MPGVAVERYGLIFDLDGTLVDSYSAIAEALNRARAAYELEPLDETTVRCAVGHGLESLIANWVGPERVEDGVRLFREHYAQFFERRTKALPGVDATLRRLSQAGYGMALASNKPTRFSRPILHSLGWAAWFVAVEGPDTVGTTKPATEMLATCRAKLESSRRSTRYIGDMPLDAESGRRAGIDVILVTGGSASETELRAAGPPVLSDIEALPAHLSALGWPQAPALRR